MFNSRNPTPTRRFKQPIRGKHKPSSDESNPVSSFFLKVSQHTINNPRGTQMRTAITFDTLEFMDELKRSGMKPEAAEAITKATSKALNQMMETKELATKKDLNDTKIELIKYISDSTWKTIGILATFQTVILGIFGLIQYCIK